MTSAATLGPAFATRRRGVLAFTCAVHLLALLLWTQERRQLPTRPSSVATIFLYNEGVASARRPSRTGPHPLPIPPWPAPAAPVRSAFPSRSAPVPRPQDRTDTRPDARPETAPAQATAAPDAAASAPYDPFDAARPPHGPAGSAVSAVSASTRGGFAVDLAKNQAGRIDRELRKGKPGVPTEADTPWARFQRGLGGAYIDRSLSLQSDTYTSPDGVVIYRFRQGNRVRCRRAGGIGIPLRGMPDGPSASLPTAGSAGDSDCPKGVVWNQDGP
jgi:hypothetical protein